MFGQYDLGKTPYNSWGNPVQEIFFISGKLFYKEAENIVKITTTKITDLSHFCACPPPQKMCQSTKITEHKNFIEHNFFTALRTTINVI